METNRIVVTGGAGFLGKHLCRALHKDGHEVRVIDLHENPEFPTTIADVRDQAKMEELLVGADTVFHLASLIEAGESVSQPKKYFDYNVMGTIAILEAMRKNNVKNFLFSSSAAIYGEPEHIPILENDRTIPINPYGVTKLAMEGLLSSYVSSHGFTGVALRYFNLYGPEEHHNPETHAIPRFISQIFHDEGVTVWGEGEHQRDFVYIDDIVRAHQLALQLCETQPQKYHYFNISTERAASVREIIDHIADILQKTPNIIHHEPRPGDPLVLVANAQKAHEVLGWKAEVSLEDGLRRTVDYFVRQFTTL